jgi:hypothetical protein
LVFCLFFCVACAAGNKIMTTENYSEIDVGMSVQDLKNQVGEPYSIKQYNDGVKEYEYIERLVVPDRTVETRHYFFIIKDEVVVSKRMEQEDYYKPLLERNAYDLQTSYNNDKESNTK